MAARGKTKKRNAFGYFLDDYVEKQLAAGRKISHRIGAEECALIWQQLPPEEKQGYLEKEMVGRVFTQKEKDSKFTVCGMSYAELDRKQQDLHRKIERCNQEIASLIDRSTYDSIRKHLFYTIHCHYVVKIQDGPYVPGEIAICEFNLENGIRRTYHRLINSGPLPVGYGYEAKVRREKVHDLPIPPHEDGVTNLFGVLNEVIKFIEPGNSPCGKRPPFYTVEEDMPPIENILDQLAETVNPFDNFFRVFPLHKLLFAFKNKCVQLADDEAPGFSLMSLAKTEIDKDTYRYVPSISCDYHKDSEMFYYSCSLSYVQRYAYLICNHCCPIMKIPLVPGKHTRPDTEVYEKEEEEEEQEQEEEKEEEKPRPPRNQCNKGARGWEPREDPMGSHNRYAYFNEIPEADFDKPGPSDVPPRRGRGRYGKRY